MASFGFRKSSLRGRRSFQRRQKLAIETLERRNLLTIPVSFDAGHSFSMTNFHPEHIEVAKMNGDAFEDLVVSNYVDSNRPKPLQILLGNGDGTFRSNFSLAPPDRAVDLDLGDYNNDGRADVFLVYATTNAIFHQEYHLLIYPGNGDGTLQGALSQVTDLGESFYLVSVADFNADGRSDLVLSGSAGLTIRYGNGDGTFVNKLVDASPGISQTFISDMNGDGRRDVLFFKNSNGTNHQIGARLQNSDGTWQVAKTSPLAAGPYDLVTGDFNEDGKRDIAVSEAGVTLNTSTRIQIKLGNGLGNFTDKDVYLIDGIVSPELAAADFNLDFHVDLAITARKLVGVVPTSFYSLTGLGNGSFDPFVPGTAASDDTNVIAHGDFNNDGKIDLMLGLRQADHLATFLNTSPVRNSIRGMIWEDYNQNGNFDSATEPRLAGRTVWADQNDNNLIDAGESRAVTRTDGAYELLVPNGTYKVRQLLPSGWIETPRGLPGEKGFAHTISVTNRQIKAGWNFSTYFLGTISGRVWNDYNANQIIDQVESGLFNRSVYIDLNGSGTFNAGEPLSITRSDGGFGFDVAAGTYLIREVPVAGWFSTNVISYSVTIAAGQAAYNRNFGRTKLGGVSGTVYYDISADGYRNDSDPKIPNVRVYLDKDNDAVYDVGEPTAVTDVHGAYSIGNQFPGNGLVRLIKPTGHVFINPAPNAAGNASFTTFIFGGFLGGYTDFGLIFPAFASGKVFNDKDADGVIDAGEPNFANIYVFVDYNGNGTPDLNEPSALTDANGNYRVKSSLGGAHAVIALKPSGFNATIPSSAARNINLVQGQTASGQNFGFVQGPFSNAPYQPPINIATGSNPVSLAAGDFNNDGKADFVVANNFFPGQIFLGQGNGLFTQGDDFTMGAATRYLVAVDLNADGKLDLVVANQDDNAVGVLLGNGNGTFQSLVLYPALAGTYGVAVADFNGDGKLDIVATGNESNFAWLKGNGNGTFENAVTIVSTFGGISIAAGDINGDGKKDVVFVSQSDSSINYHRGIGDGTFAAGVRMTAGVNQPSFVALADLNNDTKLDLVYLNEFSDQAVVQLGIGDGTFGTAMNFATASDPRQLAIIDVDRDGKLDLVVSCRSDGTTDISGGVSILRGRGDGTFLSHLVSTAHTSPTAVAIADYNGDSKLDIVAANFFSSDVSLLLNGTTGPFGSIAGLIWNDVDVDGIKDAGEAGLANQTVFADVDNDGVLDPGERFTISTSNGAYVLGNLAAGTYRIRPVSTADHVQSSPANRLPLTVALAAGANISNRNLGLAPTTFDGGRVFDNSTAKLVGSWNMQTLDASFFASNYISDGNAGKGTKSAQFEATLTFDGYYQVYVRWTVGTNHAPSVPIDVVNAKNTRRVFVNQTVEGGKWVSLGVYYFTSTGGSVFIRNVGTIGIVVVDAVKFVAVPAPAVFTKDNTSAGVVISGTWNALTTPVGFYGANYLTDGNPAVKGIHVIKFDAGNLGSAGTYEVFAWWSAAADRATNARFDIATSTGVSSVMVNQRQRGGRWVSLGYFNLNAVGASVSIRNEGANGVVVADAVQFVRVS